MNSTESKLFSREAWRFALPAVLLLAVVGYVIFRDTLELPSELGDLIRVHVVEGEKANEILNRMHDKEVTPTTNMIGMYSRGNSNAVVYLSQYRSDEDARIAYEKMARSIEKGNLLFTEYRSVRLANRDASFCVGQGQDHYFFAEDNRLYWLAADSAISEKTAIDLMQSL
jgi:hypothetical protein